MKDKLIFQRKKTKTYDSRGSIRVRESTMHIIDEIAEECTLSKIEIMDRLVKFAEKHIEWVNFEEEL